MGNYARGAPTASRRPQSYPQVLWTRLQFDDTQGLMSLALLICAKPSIMFGPFLNIN
jgi:hypothetical protein